MIKTPTNKIKQRTSLRFQYIIASTIVVALLIVGSLLASFYFKYVTESNTQSLQLRDSVTESINDIRRSIWRSDKSLYILLNLPDDKQNDEIVSHFRLLDEKLVQL